MLVGRLGLDTARLPHSDRHGLIYLDRGRLTVEDGCLRFSCAGGGGTPAGDYTIPHQSTSLVLLGPGSMVSHDALRLLARHGADWRRSASESAATQRHPCFPTFPIWHAARCNCGPMRKMDASRWPGVCMRFALVRSFRIATSRCCVASKGAGQSDVRAHCSAFRSGMARPALRPQ